MSNLINTLRSIEDLRTAIEAKGKIPESILRKIDYKFRVECNYNSNRMEGGTLTKPETRSVMVGNITVKDKPLKDIREMRGHDEVMQEILRIGQGEQVLSEKRIKEIHKAIIVAEKAEDEREIGAWKSVGNHIYNYKGERFDFTLPEDVPGEIHDLLNWLNASLDQIKKEKRGAPDPLILCFEFHLRYLTIHPFTDGNGRTARLLTNLLLISLGYPPFWVSEDGEKDTYYKYLADVQAYGGSPDLLFDFLAGLVKRSLQLVSDAIDGKDIEDVDDWKKRITLLKNSFPENDAISIVRSREAIHNIYIQAIKPTLTKLITELTIYDDLFVKRQLWFGNGNGSVSINSEADLDHVLENNPSHDKIVFTYNLEGFKKAKHNTFNIQCRLSWSLEEYYYFLAIEPEDSAETVKRTYDEFYDSSEIKEIVSRCGNILYGQIQSRIGLDK